MMAGDRVTSANFPIPIAGGFVCIVTCCVALPALIWCVAACCYRFRAFVSLGDNDCADPSVYALMCVCALLLQHGNNCCCTSTKKMMLYHIN